MESLAVYDSSDDDAIVEPIATEHADVILQSNYDEVSPAHTEHNAALHNTFPEVLEHDSGSLQLAIDERYPGLGLAASSLTDADRFALVLKSIPDRFPHKSSEGGVSSGLESLALVLTDMYSWNCVFARKEWQHTLFKVLKAYLDHEFYAEMREQAGSISITNEGTLDIQALTGILSIFVQEHQEAEGVGFALITFDSSASKTTLAEIIIAPGNTGKLMAIRCVDGTHWEGLAMVLDPEDQSDTGAPLDKTPFLEWIDPRYNKTHKTPAEHLCVAGRPCRAKDLQEKFFAYTVSFAQEQGGIVNPPLPEQAGDWQWLDDTIDRFTALDLGYESAREAGLARAEGHIQPHNTRPVVVFWASHQRKHYQPSADRNAIFPQLTETPHRGEHCQPSPKQVTISSKLPESILERGDHSTAVSSKITKSVHQREHHQFSANEAALFVKLPHSPQTEYAVWDEVPRQSSALHQTLTTWLNCAETLPIASHGHGLIPLHAIFTTGLNYCASMLTNPGKGMLRHLTGPSTPKSGSALHWVAYVNHPWNNESQMHYRGLTPSKAYLTDGPESNHHWHSKDALILPMLFIPPTSCSVLDGRYTFQLELSPAAATQVVRGTAKTSPLVILCMPNRLLFATWRALGDCKLRLAKNSSSKITWTLAPKSQVYRDMEGGALRVDESLADNLLIKLGEIYEMLRTSKTGDQQDIQLMAWGGLLG